MDTKSALILSLAVAIVAVVVMINLFVSPNIDKEMRALGYTKRIEALEDFNKQIILAKDYR